MNTIRETFDKSERLCSLKIIAGLFESGNILYTPLFKVVWGKSYGSLQYPAQVVFSVPKRVFRHAVTRNVLKRRMKEAYRKNKKILYDHLASENIQITFVVVLKGNNVPDYLTIEKSMTALIKKFIILIKEDGKIC